MLPKSHIFELYAQKCEQRTDEATDRQAKATFKALAVQWRELGRMLRLLDEDARFAEKFFKDGSFSAINADMIL